MTTRASVGTIWPWALCVLLGACSNSATPGTGSTVANGTWSGSLSSSDTIPVGVRFELHEENGQLSGQAFFQDPVTSEYLPDDSVTGTRTGADATWQTSTGLVVQGKFDTNAFTGTLEFPADEPLAVHVVDLSLKR